MSERALNTLIMSFFIKQYNRKCLELLQTEETVDTPTQIFHFKTIQSL